SGPVVPSVREIAGGIDDDRIEATRSPRNDCWRPATICVCRVYVWSRQLGAAVIVAGPGTLPATMIITELRANENVEAIGSPGGNSGRHHVRITPTQFAQIQVRRKLAGSDRPSRLFEVH